MDLQLTGKVALITGPAKGMGAAITPGFATKGCDVVLVGRDVVPSNRWPGLAEPCIGVRSSCPAT